MTPELAEGLLNVGDGEGWAFHLFAESLCPDRWITPLSARLEFSLFSLAGPGGRIEGFERVFRDRCGFYCLHRMGPGIGECSSGHGSGQP